MGRGQRGDGLVSMWSLDYKQMVIKGSAGKGSVGDLGKLTPNNFLEMLKKRTAFVNEPDTKSGARC